MSLSPEFYKSLFQHDTLFKIADEFKSTNRADLAPAMAAPENPAQNPPVKTAADFPALSHQVLILLRDQPQPSELKLLHNILKAIGHSMDSVDLFVTNQLPALDARPVVAEKRTQYFLSFGVPMTQLQLDLQLTPYTAMSHEGIWFLLAEPLPVVEPDISLKKRLWAALQQMFPKK